MYLNSLSQNVMGRFSRNLRQVLVITQERSDWIFRDLTSKVLPWQPSLVYFNVNLSNHFISPSVQLRELSLAPLESFPKALPNKKHHGCHGNIFNIWKLEKITAISAFLVKQFVYFKIFHLFLSLWLGRTPSESSSWTRSCSTINLAISSCFFNSIQF